MTAAGDAELLAAVRAGDRAALGELYRRHRPRVAGYLARRMVCAADVEDVVQDTFLRLWTWTEEFDPATHEFGAWLCGRAARWTLIDYGRKDRFRSLAALDNARDHALRPAESAHDRETRPVSPRVVTALARLTPAQRRSVQLRYLDGYSTAAAAIVAGSSPAAIATNCLAARARLRFELAALAPLAHPLAAGSKLAALRAAFAAVGAHDVAAALGWLRERGIQVHPSYAYAIRNHRRGRLAAAELDTARDVVDEPQLVVDVARNAALVGRHQVQREVASAERVAHAEAEQRADAEQAAAAARARQDKPELERVEQPERERQTEPGRWAA